MQIRCSECDARLEVDSSLLGQTISCPRCAKEIVVPKVLLLPDEEILPDKKNSEALVTQDALKELADQKSPFVAAILAFFLGFIGVHHLYLGRIMLFLLYLGFPFIALLTVPLFPPILVVYLFVALLMEIISIIEAICYLGMPRSEFNAMLKKE